MDRPELQRAEAGRVRLGAPGLALVALIAIVAAVLGASAGSTRNLSSPSPRSAPTPTSERSVAAASSMSPVSATPAAAPDPRPAWVDDLAGQLECDRALDPRLGTELTLGLKPIDPARSPAEAQRVALMSYTSLPVQGYAPIEVAGNWARHTYVVDGRLKVVMVSTDRFEDYPKVEGWEVVGIRACDLSEFRQADLAADGPTIWRDAHEVPVVSDVALSFPGPGHCGWESMVFLYLSGEQFIRDPNGLLRDHTVVSFDPTVRLPEDAIDTGLHTDRWHLFEIPSGRAVFVVTSAGAVERWPRAKQDVGCM